MSAVVRLIGAIGLAATLLLAAPQLTRAQQRAEVSEAKPRVRTPPGPEDLALPAPTRSGESLLDRGGGLYELGGGGADAGVDAGQGADAGADAGQARPPPPLDDASCSVAGGADPALFGFLFAAGLLWRRRGS
jgi:MYXO-CTERM domain-containing protein